MRFIHLLFLLTAFLLISCSGDDAQREFESQAYQDPSGITMTNNQGSVSSFDPDDWRISPIYQGTFEVTPPYPNPVQLGNLIEFEYNVLSVQAVRGLDVRIQTNGGWKNLYRSFENPLPPGQEIFRISASELSPDNSDQLARGLHRIYFFDFNQRLISYGDVEVR